MIELIMYGSVTIAVLCLVITWLKKIKDKREIRRRRRDREVVEAHYAGAAEGYTGNTKLLHSEKGPAIIRRNNKREYYLLGAYFSEANWRRIVSKDDPLSIEECLQLYTVEVCRIAMKYCLKPEILLEDWSRVFRVDMDSRGNILYQYLNDGLNEPIKILKYEDPSTYRVYCSFIPPRIKNATSAMAWKFQLSDKEYGNLRSES